MGCCSFPRTLCSLLPVCHSAHNAHYSTETTLAMVRNNIVMDTEQKNRVRTVSALVLLDLIAAFDTVNHKLLLDALERRFEIRDLALKWFTLYLAGRMQNFQVRTNKSKTVAVNYRMLQGSVLGPLKLTAYTEDLPSVVEEHIVNPCLYADDGQLNDHLLLSDVGAAIPKMKN